MTASEMKASGSVRRFASEIQFDKSDQEDGVCFFFFSFFFIFLFFNSFLFSLFSP